MQIPVRRLALLALGITTAFTTHLRAQSTADFRVLPYQLNPANDLRPVVAQYTSFGNGCAGALGVPTLTRRPHLRLPPPCGARSRAAK